MIITTAQTQRIVLQDFVLFCFELSPDLSSTTTSMPPSKDQIQNKSSNSGTAPSSGNTRRPPIGESSRNVEHDAIRTTNLKDEIRQNHATNLNNHASTHNDAIVASDVGRTPSRGGLCVTSDDLGMTSGDLLPSLPEDTEKVRMQWMKECASLR